MVPIDAANTAVKRTAEKHRRRLPARYVSKEKTDESE